MTAAEFAGCWVPCQSGLCQSVVEVQSPASAEEEHVPDAGTTMSVAGLREGLDDCSVAQQATEDQLENRLRATFPCYLPRCYIRTIHPLQWFFLAHFCRAGYPSHNRADTGQGHHCGQ